MKRVVGIGAGGHAKVLIDALQRAGGVDIHGLTDRDPARRGTRVLGVPVLGTDDIVGGLRGTVDGFFIGLGSVARGDGRRRLYEWMRELGFEPVSVVHPSAVIAPSATIGPGAMVLAGAIVNADARVGCNVIINTGAIVEHDCMIGDHAHIATGARLASTVTVGEGAHIGVGASVRQCIRIGAGAVVGAGAAVVADVEPGAVVGGAPARPLRSGAGA